MLSASTVRVVLEKASSRKSTDTRHHMCDPHRLPDFYQALQKNPRIFDYFIDRFVRPEPLETLPAEVRGTGAFQPINRFRRGQAGALGCQTAASRPSPIHVAYSGRAPSLQPSAHTSPLARPRVAPAWRQSSTHRRGASDLRYRCSPRCCRSYRQQRDVPARFWCPASDIIDELRTETPTIQDNVAFTVAQLDQRIPDKDKRRVLGLAVRRAGDSGALRWRLGPSKLRDLAPYADSEELRALGRALIEDITADPANIRLPSQEHPSLREGRELAQEAADLVVDIVQMADVPPQAQAAFGRWLLTRTVNVAKQSTHIPLAWLEDKLAAHGAALLPLIREDYPRIIAEEFSREQPEPLDLSAIAARLDTVFEYFFKQGAQTRAKLWGFLKDFAALRQPPFVTLAFAKFATWHNDADDATANATLAAMGARLVGHEEDAGAWPLDDEPALRDIYTNLAGARTPFDADGIGHIVSSQRNGQNLPNEP